MNPPLLFFTVHTYFGLLVKLIAYLALSRFVSGFGTRFGSLYSLDDTALSEEMKDLEQGGLFRRLGIRNFLEGDFFRWYIHAWDGGIADAVRLLVSRLKDYDPGTLDVRPEATRDLLKKLYHYLMPRELRHDLGEYYTPDWLAERLLNQLGYEGDPRTRLLDPACGSGTFLILAIRRLKDRCLNKEGMNEQETLRAALQNIIGIDLNPLAVIASRTNFLLALGDLLEHRTEEIDIPVYLADSIMVPAGGGELFTRDRYLLRTAVGVLEVPSALRSRKQIETLANVLAECVEAGAGTEAFRRLAEKRLEIPPRRWEGTDGEGEPASDVLLKLYETLKGLHEAGLDGIWAAILKNAFMPRFIGRFTFVAGNPPWVNWEHLPAAYREESARLWARYELFPGSSRTKLASARSKVDLAVLMTQVALDKFLEKSGKLGFVLPQNVFQTETGGRGFRRFRLPDGRPIRVSHVDDLVELQPFEGATNRTSVAILELGKQTSYPVPYTYWVKRGAGFSIRQEATLVEVQGKTERRRWFARPINVVDSGSPWIVGRPKAIKGVASALGTSPYKELAREGSNTRGANGVFWVRLLAPRPGEKALVQNLPEAGKRRVDQREAIIENTHLYPLLRGRNVGYWTATPELFIVVPHDPAKPSDPIIIDDLLTGAPLTYKYFASFEKELRGRKRFRNFDPSKGPFYGLYNVGRYTFAPYKVVWREQADGVVAAVAGQVGGRPVVPDHKLMSVSLNDSREAHFVCALLNSLVIRYIVDSYAIDISISTHLLDYLNIPRFEPSKQRHLVLAELSVKAHRAQVLGDGAGLGAIESEVDKTAADILGISGEALGDIRRSYEELRAGGHRPAGAREGGGEENDAASDEET